MAQSLLFIIIIVELDDSFSVGVSLYNSKLELFRYLDHSDIQPDFHELLDKGSE